MDFFSISLLIIAVFIVIFGIQVINQYERGVVLTLGKFTGIKDPGLRFVIPIIQRIHKVDIRMIPHNVPQQEVITRDNVTVKVDAVVYFRVTDTAKAILENLDYIASTSQFAQAALRDVAGNVELDDLLSKRAEISKQIQEIIDVETVKWGVDVSNVKLQNIELPENMKRSMAKQAEAERERRANIINADGEKLAATNLSEAAEILAKIPGALNLRTLNTLERISTEPSQKTMFLFPVELIDALRGNNVIKPGK